MDKLCQIQDYHCAFWNQGFNSSRRTKSGTASPAEPAEDVAPSATRFINAIVQKAKIQIYMNRYPKITVAPMFCKVQNDRFFY